MKDAGMDLPKEKIKRYNKIIQEKYGRDVTEEEILFFISDSFKLSNSLTLNPE